MSDTSPTAPIGGPLDSEPREPSSEHLAGITSGTLWDGRYLIERSLGDGGMGCVLLARDLGRPRSGPVALKVLQPRFREVATPYFMREYAVQRQLRHPNVAAALDLGFDHQDGEEVPYFAMQHVPGVPLAEILQEDPVPLPEVWRWMLEALEAVDAIHRAGFLHRDIKPGNVLVDRSATGSDRPVVRLIDFGIAVPLTGDPETFFIGTPEFSAPERIECEPLDVRSDLYSLGLLLYELIEGRPPWEGTDPNELLQARRDHTAPPIQNPKCPHEVAELVAELLALDPNDRPSSAGEVIVRLREVTECHGPIESPEAFAARIGAAVPTSASYMIALEAAASPGGKALVINVPVGHDGQGLLEALGDRASLAGVRVVRLRLEGRRGPPLHELEAALDVFRRLRRRDLKSPLLLRGMAGAATMLTRLHRPTLLSIEGLERADEATLMVLASAFLGAHNANLTVVATMATGARPKAPAAFAEFLTHGFVRHVGLQPMSRQELTRHLVALLGVGVLDEGRVQALHAESRGLPTELVRLLATAYRRGELVRRASDYVWVGDPTSSLQDPRVQVTGELADRLSLLRQPLPFETVLRYVDDRSGVERLVAEGMLILTDGDWLTCVMRDALSRRYGLLSTHRRRALHRRLADALLGTPPFPGHAGLVADQLAETTRPAQAAPWLIRAAQEAADQGAGGRTSELLDRAMDLLEADHGEDQTLWDWKRECFEATIVLARASCDHERLEAAIEMLLHIGAEAGHLPTIERALLARIDHARVQGNLAGMKNAVTQLLVFQESCGGEPAEALSAWVRAIEAAVAGELAAAFDASAEGLGLPGADLPDVRVRLLAFRAELAVACGVEAVAPRAIEKLEKAGGDARAIGAAWLRKTGDVAGALARLGTAHPPDAGRALFELERAECHLALGQHDKALEIARLAVQEARRERSPAISFAAEGALAEAMLRGGQKATARARLERLVQSPPRAALPQAVHHMRYRALVARLDLGEVNEVRLAAEKLAGDASRRHDLAGAAAAVLLAGRAALKERRAMEALQYAEWLAELTQRRPVGGPPEHVVEWLLANAHYQMKWFKSANMFSRRAMESLRVSGHANGDHAEWLGAADPGLLARYH